MIEETIAKWHQHLRGDLPGGLDELLDDDVVFYSPIVFTPQRGKEVTKLYLGAAFQTLGGDGDDEVGAPEPDGEPAKRGFRYVHEVMAGDVAFLEFETTMGGKYVNGVDIITVGVDGKIVEFKVMIRPLQAVNLLHEQMRMMLEKMQAGG